MYIYLSSYPPNHLCIYLSIYLTIELATDFSLYLDTNLQSPACIWIEDWRFHRNSFLKSSILRGDWRSEEKILWNLHSEGEKASICLPIPFHSIRPSIHPSYPSTHTVHPSILSVHLHIYLPSYLFTYLSTYLSTNLSSSIFRSIHLSNYTFIQRCNPWVACGLKIQERTIFSPKKGTEGTDNKKHWEASKPTIKQNCTGFDTY